MGTERTVIRVLLCDDHVVVREGLRHVLEALSDIEVVAAVSDGERGVESAVRDRPDVVLMDLSMPGLGGVEATRQIVARVPATRVVVLTSFSQERRVLAAIDAGAIGYLVKDAPPEQVVDGIRAAARGDAWLDPRAARAVVAQHGAGGPMVALSEREQEVLSLVVGGLSNKLIARRLGIAEGTVKAHLTRVFREIGVDSRSQAALWARERGL